MRRSHTPKKKSSRSQAAAASLKATTAAAGTDGEFAEFGAMAGPPARPEVSDVDSTTLQLKWLPPTHTGGSGLEISGYHVQMQVSGDSGYTTHTPDTGSALPELSVARLQANTWHEFRVAAVTAAGLGTPSPPSRPVLTQRAPKLAKEILRAQHALEKMRLELTEKREARLRLAREATLLQGGRDDPQQRQVQLARRALLSDQVVELEKAHSEQHRRLQGLHSQQARLESHQQAWRQQDEPAEDESPEKDAGGGAAAAPSQARRASFVSGGITAATDGGPGPRPRRGGGGMHDVVRTLEAYTRLFAKEDTFVEETYPEWDREAARAQLMNALGAHAIADGERNKIAYFNLALNRVRSGESHNVFNRVDDERLEKLALMFSRFDSDHDGVLEFADFCHIMLMVGTRLHTQYTEEQLQQMFRKADVNNDRLLDLNEFIKMQIKPRDVELASAGSSAPSTPPRPPSLSTRSSKSESAPPTESEAEAESLYEYGYAYVAGEDFDSDDSRLSGGQRGDEPPPSSSRHSSETGRS